MIHHFLHLQCIRITIPVNSVRLTRSESSLSVPLGITLDSSSTENFIFGSVSNASNDSESDGSFDLLTTLNSLDDFFSSGIQGNVLQYSCSSVCNSRIATPGSDFLFTYVSFFLALRFLMPSPGFFLALHFLSPSPSLLYLSLNATNFFLLSSHHTLPVYAKHTLVQNFLAPAWGSFILAHMRRVVPYPFLSFLLCKHNHPL